MLSNVSKIFIITLGIIIFTSSFYFLKNNKSDETVLPNTWKVSNCEPNVCNKERPTLEQLKWWKDRKGRREEIHPLRSKYLAFINWPGGFNNQRMTLEMAYVLAWAINRTLIIPTPKEPLWPFNFEVPYHRTMDVDDMKKGWACLSEESFKRVPNYDEIIKGAMQINWTEIHTHMRGVVLPRIPTDPDELSEIAEWKRWRWPRDPNSIILHSLDDYPGAENTDLLILPKMTLFGSFHVQYYFAKASNRTLKEATELVRNHVHYNSKVIEYAHAIINALPPCFSSMHYRRGDFIDTRPTLIDKTVGDVFIKTYNLLNESEHLWVSTDENTEALKNEFIPVLSRRYSLHFFSQYKHLIPGCPQELISLVECVVCANGRVFLGSKASTMTGYINRLRGYNPLVQNKEIYYNGDDYPSSYINPTSDDLLDPLRRKDWAREYPEAWNLLDD